MRSWGRKQSKQEKKKGALRLVLRDQTFFLKGNLFFRGIKNSSGRTWGHSDKATPHRDLLSAMFRSSSSHPKPAHYPNILFILKDKTLATAPHREDVQSGIQRWQE